MTTANRLSEGCEPGFTRIFDVPVAKACQFWAKPAQMTNRYCGMHCASGSQGSFL